MKSQPNVLKNPKSMFIVLGVIIVVGLLSIILLVNKPASQHASLSEGEDYNIENISPGKYKLTDDNGNTINLTRARAEDIVFVDGEGRLYFFVSGSPYRFVGME
jgi:cell division protein FtsI/penicillin-binding protein 2